MSQYCLVTFIAYSCSVCFDSPLVVVFVRHCCCFVYLLSQLLQDSLMKMVVRFAASINTTYSCACTAITKKVVSKAFIVKIVLFSKIPSGCFLSTHSKNCFVWQNSIVLLQESFQIHHWLTKDDSNHKQHISAYFLLLFFCSKV